MVSFLRPHTGFKSDTRVVDALNDCTMCAVFPSRSLVQDIVASFRNMFAHINAIMAVVSQKEKIHSNFIRIFHSVSAIYLEENYLIDR